LADLQKGEAVMVVATEGGTNGVSTVITLLGGVEPFWRLPPRAARPQSFHHGASAAGAAGKRQLRNAARARLNDIHSGDLMSFLARSNCSIEFDFSSADSLDWREFGCADAYCGLNGVVTDPSGGVIAKAAVRLTTTSGASLDTATNRDGVYEFKGLAREHTP